MLFCCWVEMKMKQETENRKCIVCGEVKEKELLLRFTLAPDNQVVPDFKKKLPGKGIYVSVSKTALQKAVEKNLFANTGGNFWWSFYGKETILGLFFNR